MQATDNPLFLRLSARVRLDEADFACVQKLSAGNVQTFHPHTDIHREGERADFITLFISGWGYRYKLLPDGRRQIVGFTVPGDLCDFDTFVTRRFDHSLAAMSRSRIVQLGKADLEQLLDTCPAVQTALRWHSVVDLSTQREWTVSVGQRNAYERIAHLMAEMFTRLRVVGLTNGGSCDWPATQNDLADATGLTAVHVNRTLQQLRKDGLIVLERRQLIIPDFERLAQAGLFNPNYLDLDYPVAADDDPAAA